MKKFLIFLGFFVSFFLVKSVFANEIRATAPDVNIQALFNNQSGGIDVNTLSIVAWDNLGVAQSPFSPPLGISKGSTGTYFYSATISSDASPSLSWSTSCKSVSGVSPISSSVDSNGVTIYTFADQDIHCTNTNSTIAVTATSCDAGNNGSVTWSVDNIGTDGANISSFSIFKSNGGNPELDTNPTTVPYISTPLTTFYTATGGTTPKLAGLTSGTWNIVVKAYPPNGASGIFATPPGSFTCGQGTGGTYAPSNLIANASCSGTPVRADLSWYKAIPGSYTYTVQYVANATLPNPPGDPGQGGSWPNAITVSTADLTYANISTLSQATTYWWRVKAVRAGYPDLYSLSSSFLTPSACGGSYSAPSVDSYPTVVCASTQDSSIVLPGAGDLVDDAADNYRYADKTWVKIKWGRSTPASDTKAEVVDLSTSNTFVPGSYSSYTLPTPVDISSTQKILMINSSTFPNISITSGTTYFYRVREKMANNQWYVSEVRSFVGPTYCNDAPSSQTGIAIDHKSSICVAGVPWIYINWTNYNIPNKFQYDPNDSTKSTVFKIMRGSSLKGWSSGLSFEVSYLDSGFTAWSVIPYWSGTSGLPGTAVSTSSNGIFSGCGSSGGTIIPPIHLAADTTVTPCGGINPKITFSFWDNLTSAHNDFLEVSSEPFTGPYTTNSHNSWAYVSLPASGSPVSFTWSATGGGGLPMGFGNANWGSTVGNNLIPMDGTTYYWRVRTNDNSGYSSPYVTMMVQPLVLNIPVECLW